MADGEWGDAVTLQAAADVYGVVVCLHRTPPTAPPTIWLAFWAESHYASIVPEEDFAGAAPS
ncbi:thiol-dependent ubiquitin-specific protease [Aureococcus anophagefferens]|nr:thiol-dependent ubiquitin-specific protease [Aureococcus anophagefferens]